MGTARKRTNADSLFTVYFETFFAAIVIAAGVLYLLLNPQYRTGIYNDDAVYTITARDFWNTPALHPLLQLKPDYPLPGLPLLLAPFAHGPHWYRLGWVSVMATFISVALFGFWVRKWFSPGETLAIMVLYAFNPLVARFSGIVMPVTYYILMAIAGFYLMTESLGKPHAAKILGLGFVLGWASLIRPEGGLLLASVTCGLLWSRRGRKILPAMLAPVIGWSLFALMWFQQRTAERTEYGSDLAALKSFWAQHPLTAVPFAFKWFQTFLYTGWTSLQSLEAPSFLNFSLVVLFLLLGGSIIGFRSLWKRLGMERAVFLSIGLFCLSYFVVHVFWHVADARYFVQFVPFLAIFLVAAVGQRKWGKGLLLVLCVTYVFENGRALREAMWEINPRNQPPLHCLDWIKENTPALSKVNSNIAPTVDLYTGRATSPLLNANSVDLLQYLLLTEELETVLLREGSATTPGIGSTENLNVIWDRYRRWLHHYPQRFTIGFSDVIEGGEVFRVQPNPKFVQAYKIFISAAKDAKEERYEQAFAKTQQSLAIDPTLGCAVNLLGALTYLGNEFKMSEKAFLRATELLPDSPNAMINLASLYHRAGQEEKAHAFLQKGIEINSANGNEPEFNEKIRRMTSLWDKNTTELFIDFPHPSLYSSN